MKALCRIRTAGMLFLLALAVTVGSGCKKQRASLNLKKLNDIVKEATVHEAAKYNETDFASVQKQVQEAQDAFSREDWTPAFDFSRNALPPAEAMLDNVKQERAADRQNIASEDIDIAQSNQGEQEDAERFKSILDFRDKGAKAYTKSNWGDAIENFLKVSEGVDNLLAPMKSRAEGRMENTKAMARTMVTEGVRDHAANLGIEVDELIKQAEKLITEQRQYKTAQTVMSTTEVKINDAIEKAKEVRSLIDINQIETDLLVAMQKGAYVFYRDRLTGAAEAYENTLRAFEARSFDACLQATAMLKERVAQLKFDTRKRSAETKVASLKSTIENLTGGGAREYLPGRVEVLDDMLREAEGQVATDTEDGFDEAEEIAEAASEEYRKIQADFNELANQAIAQANNQLEIATEVFRATDRIFDIPSPSGEATTLEQQLERNKQAMKAEIEALLEAARKMLGSSQLKRDNGLYRDSILMAEQVQETATIVQDETYRVVAHNSLLEIEAHVTFYAAEASQYAPEALAKARQLLTDVRETIGQEQYKTAVDQAAIAKAQLDVMKQELGARGAQGLREAEEVLRQAVGDQALEHAPDQMAQARQSLEEAVAARDLANYKEVIEQSAQALALAQSALTSARRLNAEQQIGSAEGKLQRAALSHADLYAARAYKDAGEKLAAARQMFDSASYEESARLAAEAAKTSDEAAFERVIEAEKQIATAAKYNSWKYDSRTVANSINAAKAARRHAEAGDFDTARSLADESVRLAGQAISTTKDSEVGDRLTDLAAGVDKGIEEGANYFQSAEVKELIDRISALEDSYDESNYEAAAEQLRDMESRLAEMLINTPAVLERSVLQQMARRQSFLDSPIDIEAYAEEELEVSEQQLRWAKIDFEEGKYRQAYDNLRKGTRLLDVVQNILAVSQYNSRIAELFGDFVAAQENFRHVIGITETALVQLALNTADRQAQALAVVGEYDPIAFREAMEELYKRARTVEPPKNREEAHDAVLLLFQLARSSAQNFEKLVILDQYDNETAREIIHEAYEQLRRARDHQQEIEKTFREPGSDTLIVRRRKALGLQLY
jgi:hypothetical protein